MKRKVIQIADSTVLVSIPSKWAKKYGLKKGDSVDVEEEHSKITITAENIKKQTKKTIVDAKDLEERTLRWVLASTHRSGYDEIEILYNNNKTLKTIEDMIKNVMLGFIIINQEENKVTLKPMAIESINEFDQTLRRIFLVTLSLADNVLGNLKNQKEEDIITLEKTNNQLTNFCERLLNMGAYDYNKTTFLYVICWNLEKIADEYKYIFQLGDIKVSSEILRLFQEVNDIFKEVYNAFYEFDIKKFNNLYKDAKKLEEKLIDAGGNFELKHHLVTIIAKLLDLPANFIGLKNIEKK